MFYENMSPIPDKYLCPDGSIKTFNGVEVHPSNVDRISLYNVLPLQVAKWLASDGSIKTFNGVEVHPADPDRISLYNTLPLQVDKWMYSDGSIKTADGTEYAPSSLIRAVLYAIMDLQAAKWLMPDGSIQTLGGEEVDSADEYRANLYERATLQAAKWLQPDETVEDYIPTNGQPVPPIVYRTVTYNANDGTGTITDPLSPYVDGSFVEVLSSTGMSRQGYNFLHWNTQNDDEGTVYQEEDIFTISSNVILYAIWEVAVTPFVFECQVIEGYTSIYLPLVETGTYDFIVDWGDGSVDSITEYNSPSAVHDYGVPGTYIVTITGTIIGWSFGLYEGYPFITNITSWGCLNFAGDISAGAFAFCVYLVIEATDTPVTTDCTSLQSMFLGCDSLTSIPNLGNWDVSNVTNMIGMFFNCPLFNQDIIGWNTSNVINMNSMFNCSTVFNGGISTFNVSGVQDFSGMFSQAEAFNQDLSSWDVSSASGMSNMFSGSALTTENYDKLLNSFASQSVQSGVQLDVDCQYTSVGKVGRDILTDTYGWTINDGGMY